LASHLQFFLALATTVYLILVELAKRRLTRGITDV
jgi:hypothetical protein